MHPAPSLILFTVLSGLGFGLLAFLGAGFPEKTGPVAFGLYGLGFALAGGGLLAAAFHLGHPERALLAFTQWRTSWLSREAVLSAGTLAVLAPHAASAVFLDRPIPVLGWIGAAGAVATVVCTAMIYAQLRTVPRWRDWTTPAVFVAASAAGGALLAGHLGLAGWLMLALAALMALHWARGDGRFAAAGHSAETATGLGRLGRVRLFAPPHTGSNYLLSEMVHRIGRKHRIRLRALALALTLAAAAVLLLAPAGYAAAGVAMLLHLPAMLAARWLFFAEAEHVVGLYYGLR